MNRVNTILRAPMAIKQAAFVFIIALAYLLMITFW